MNQKMKSAIEKITLNDVTFSNEVIDPTYVNFFYGKNGAGKSTIARTFKVNDEHLQWQDGRVSTDYDVLVKEVDYDPIKRQTLEIDFQVLTEGEKVHSVAEIVLVNHDKVQGVVEQHMEEIPYKAAKSALVEKVSVDIGELKPGDSIKVGDLDIAKDKDVSISPDVLEKVIVSVTEQTYAETDTDTDEDGEASEA